MTKTSYLSASDILNRLRTKAEVMRRLSGHAYGEQEKYVTMAETMESIVREFEGQVEYVTPSLGAHGLRIVSEAGK